MTASMPGYSAAWTPAVRQRRGPGRWPCTTTRGRRIGSVGVSPMVRNPLARVPGLATMSRMWTASASIHAPHDKIAFWHLAYGNGSDTMRLLFALSSREMLGGWMAVAGNFPTEIGKGGVIRGNRAESNEGVRVMSSRHQNLRHLV